MRSAMSRTYRLLVRPFLFCQDAENIHNRTMRALSWASRNPHVSNALRSFFGAPELAISVFGLHFPNPVGLAAGMDKNAEALPAWSALGFGFTELGAVTWHAQPGNPVPRVFRAIPDEAIVNRMGFNNAGAQAIAETLGQWRRGGRWPKHPVGMNLGKSKVTPLNKAAEDYANSMRVLLPHLDFFVVNVSSPNTPNLRKLQDKSLLDEILAALQEVQGRAAMNGGDSNALAPNRKPVLVKVAPDLSFEALDDILEVVTSRQIAGIVATNTTVARPPATDRRLERVYNEQGGLSGRPLRNRSSEIVRHLYRHTGGAVPIIGVGGIFDAADAWEKITAGASLVQIYTGLVYEGPGVARSTVRGLKLLLQKHGLANLQEAVGIAHR